ncbi:MAG TPA: PilC/PilY family type IV pilus protein [Thermoanaerobaculia bacterium]|nr:PilC/PilY family type IV pilus protein [Thermoanaerobaculia bacterium]
MIHRRISRHLRPVLTAAALGALALPLAPPAGGDDRDLLRFKVAKPYVFVLLDTSGSMNLKIGAGNVPLEGHADDPDSRLYGAKEALFSVLSGVDDVQFGFAAWNQDRLRVGSVHWLYYLEQIPGDWPFQGSSSVVWPRADVDGLTTDRITVDTNGDGIADSGDGVPDSDIQGDAMVFGTAFTDANGAAIPGGSCAAPIDLGTETGRRKVNAFAKTGTTGNDTTTIWFMVQGGPTGGTWRLVVERPGNRPDGSTNAFHGQQNMVIKLRLSGPVTSCASPPTEKPYNFVFRLDSHLDRFVMVDRGVAGSQGSGTGNATEWTAALWPWSDATSTADCGSSHPFTGKAWEGNYDSGVEPPDAPAEAEDVDAYCVGDTCVELKPMQQTVLSSVSRALDEGDMLPFHWEDGRSHKNAILQRLAPNWPEQNPDFSVAHHLTETPGALSVHGPRVAGRPPLVAVGSTPLEASLNDFRCWYMGNKGKNPSGKCGDSAFFEEGWSQAACANDPEYGCRRPYLLIISDGANTCSGENATADLSDMKSFSGVTTFALNLGDPGNCASGGGLHSIVKSTGGQCLNVANKQQLKDFLLALIGQFREQAQTFATAAVPSVQATADQSIYISIFTPLNGKPVWDGHLNAFLKPLPVTTDGNPDTTLECGDGVEAGCHLWDAGTAILGQFNAADRLGNGVGQRRVSYALFQNDDAVPAPARALDPIECGDSSAAGYDDCLDLLNGMEIPYLESDPNQMSLAQDRANLAITAALTPRTHTLQNLDGTPGQAISYLLGDIFHSDPVVVGPPRNFLYFGQDPASDGSACAHDDSGNPGYRCFALRHRFRRKVIYVGSNDGALHALEAGRFRESDTDPSTGKTLVNHYDNGTGHELFAFVPRAVLPTLRLFSETTKHRYAVDGSPAVADVFIDAAHNGTPVLAARRWRSILVGSLREGGRQYFALDVTQPDKLKDPVSGTGYVPDDGGASNWVPSCMTAYSASECGPVRYGSVLWELDDSHTDSVLLATPPPHDPPLAMDEDGNLEPDLGDTWSRPTIGRIRLCAVGGTRCDPTPAQADGADDLVTHEVAVFGGGMDPNASDKSQPKRGDFLYMVDLETGKVIYKRRLCSPYVSNDCVTGGAAPSDVAAVDTNQDGYLDRVYVGTTAGFLYRADLGVMTDGKLPTLASETTTAVNASQSLVGVTVLRVQRTDTSGTPVWEPRAIFDANWSNDGTGGVTPTAHRRQLYHPPSVFFAARLGLFGLAFGSGNRENLWDRTEQPGRFYLLLDDTDALASSSLPLDEGDLLRIAADDPNQSIDLFSRPAGQRGWFIALDPDERIITESFVLSGLTTFSAFQPETALTEDDGGNVAEETCGEKKFETDVDNLCARTGFSRTFLVATTTGNGLFTDVTGNKTRYVAVSTFVTTSFTEAGLVKSSGSGQPVAGTSDELTLHELDLMENLKTLFPPTCRFANYRLDLKMVVADTRLQRIASIPICLEDKNWKEF